MKNLKLEGKKGDNGNSSLITTNWEEGIIEFFGQDFLEKDGTALASWIQDYQQASTKPLTLIFDDAVCCYKNFPFLAKEKAKFNTSYAEEHHSPIAQALLSLNEFNYCCQARAHAPLIMAFSDQNLLQIEGDSYSSITLHIFQPIFSWLERFFTKPQQSIRIAFKMAYFNTSTARKILELLRLAESYEKEHNGEVKVSWYFDKEDIDMEAAGEEYEGDVDLDFEFIPIDTED